MLTLVSILTALGISLICTPLVRNLAFRHKIVALTNHRTIHENTIPKLGGLSIFLAFIIALMIFAAGTGNINDWMGLLIGGVVVLLIGLADDIWGLSCYRKLLGQILAAAIAVFLGFVGEVFYLPSGESLNLGLWAVPLSVFWIVIITNAINLIDGMDGLATGFSIIIGVFMAIIAMLSQNYPLAWVAVILIAACSGFLKFNFSPAKIFLGDTGSLFLGFSLACLSLKTLVIPNSGIHTLVALSIFMVPLTDTLLSIFRRISNGRHPFWADKQHIHHRLLATGMSQAKAVLVIYAATLLCGIISLLFFIATFRIALLIFAGLTLLFFFALNRLNCFDFFVDKPTIRKSQEIQFQQKASID